MLSPNECPIEPIDKLPACFKKLLLEFKKQAESQDVIMAEHAKVICYVLEVWLPHLLKTGSENVEFGRYEEVIVDNVLNQTTRKSDLDGKLLINDAVVMTLANYINGKII